MKQRAGSQATAQPAPISADHFRKNQYSRDHRSLEKGAVMALWPFGKKNQDESAQQPSQEEAQPAQRISDEPTNAASTSESSTETESPRADEGLAHDAIGGESGPFDGDSVDINDFDFSEFGPAILNLGSLRLPLPKNSQVQVEMGEQGPKMLHIVTAHGRITPVAFAAPSSGGQWDRSVDEIVEGMSGQGMPTSVENGPWGREVVGTGTNGVIRILGVDGPRWMLRMTLAAPQGKESDLAVLGREIAARTFVYRGDDPILAGNSLPVVLPAQLADQVQQAVQQRAQQMQQAQGGQAQGAQAPAQNPQQPAQPGASSSDMHDAMRKLMEEGEGTEKK